MHHFRRWATVGVLTVAGVALGAGIASAHVTVTPSEAAQGGYTTLTFRVPNESPTAGTVKVDITIPATTPIATVRYRAVPGWTAKAVTEKLPAPVKSADTELTEAVTSVTFTADSGTRIGPGEFAEFDLSVGPLPDIDAISFPVDQTYDDGSVVAWDQPTPADGTEPEHPAPTLTLTAGGADDHHDAGSSAATAASSAGPASTTGPTVTAPATTGPATTADPQSAESVAKSDTAARTLAVVGIVVGALGLLVGALRSTAEP